MNIGILYDVRTVTNQGSIIEHSLLSSVTKLENALEEMGQVCYLFDAATDLNELINKKGVIDIVINYVPWTRTNKKILHPTLLNLLNIPFVGNSAESLVICADKVLTKLLAHENGIEVPRYMVLSGHTKFNDIVNRFGLPFVIKANRSSGSLGVKLIRNEVDFFKEFDVLTESWGDDIFAEEFIEGVDITVPVITSKRIPKALGTLTYYDENNKIISFFTHDRKYHERLRCENYYDPCISPQAMGHAEKIHQLCRCTSLSRVDFRLTPKGKLYLLEINATPELNPKGAFTTAGSGSTFSNIIAMCIEEGLFRDNTHLPEH